MQHFKHLKSGMSLLEVVAAIAILATFGSSIFLMQQYLFDRMIIAQQKLVTTVRMQTELVATQKAILKEFFEQQGPVEKSLKPRSKNFKNPDMIIKTTTVKSNVGIGADEKDSSFKKFPNLHLISVQATKNEKDFGALYAFVYIPEVVQS